MIQIIRSHKLEILSDALAEKLGKAVPSDPFTSQKIIVPNQDTGRWFKLHSAEKSGIAANLECILPAEWLWGQIRKIYPELPEILPSDLQPMKWALYRLLMNPDIRKKFAALDRYIGNQANKKKEEAVFQLAGQIASVFDEYLVYRPGMILRWQNGHSGKGDEVWQAELWRMLNHSWKKSNKTETEKNRAELYADVSSAISNRKIEPDNYLFVFNPGLLPLPIVKLLQKTGKESELFFYQTEFTRDLENNSNELVQAFGGEAENVGHLLIKLDTKEPVSLHPEVSGKRPLNKIQAAILDGKPSADLSESGVGLQGIEIRSCHSPLREIEVLHQFLLEQFESDENLHPDDVLIATPDPESYKPYIKAVFDQVEKHLPQIPYHLGYSRRTSEGGIDRALIHLLSLIDSRFEFSAVTDLFMMKPVHQSFGISESDCSKLKRWMEENHVVWGLDAEHKKEFGQPAEELQTWNSALRRGWSGHLLGGEEEFGADDLLLYHAVRTTSDQEIWAAFSSYLYQLDTMRKEQKSWKKCPDWCDWLIVRMQSLFDEVSLAGRGALGVLRALKKISEQSTVAGLDGEIPYSVFKKEVVSMLDRQQASGALFTNGVTFSSMVPVRGIPFKLIALIGLNENAFPRKPVSPDFDLMAQQPLPGERDRKNEDRNLFLESVMAAGEVHYCSYIGQSQVDNEEIPPSTIVSEWADVLSLATGLNVDEIIKKETLSGFSPANFKSKRSYSEVCFQTAQHLINDGAAFSGLTLDHKIPEDESDGPVQLDELIRFYSNPIRWFLRKRFDVALREVNHEKNEFVLDHLQQHILFQRVFGWILSETPSRKIQTYLLQSGAVPVGWAGERKVLELEKNSHCAISALRDAGIEPQKVSMEISLRLGDSVIEGVLTSYSDQQFVDVNPSKLSGKVVINSWIRHLCGQLSGRFNEKKSVLFCDLKKGEPEKRVFLTAEDAEEILSDLIDFYREGLAEPQAFFPKSLFRFEETERDGKKSDSFKKAASEFEGGDWKIGEKNDLSILTLLGSDVTFQTEFLTNRYLKIIRRMFEHMEDS